MKKEDFAYRGGPGVLKDDLQVAKRDQEVQGVAREVLTDDQPAPSRGQQAP